MFASRAVPDWADPNYRAYQQQRRNAKRRCIAFELTFDEWLQIWTASGHLAERGRGGYVMARFGDQGAYAVGNVQIITQTGNNAEAYARKTPEEIQRWQDGLRRGDPEVRDKISASMRRARAEKPWSNAPADRAAWIENLRQSQIERHKNSPRPRKNNGRFT